MSYINLNKRQKTGEILFQYNINNDEVIKLIKLNNPYKTGVKYSIYETTKNAFCSNGLFINIIPAIDKYLLMLRNNEIISFKEYKEYIFNINLLRGFDDKILDYINNLKIKG